LTRGVSHIVEFAEIFNAFCYGPVVSFPGSS
jgi:hypothetical protein